VKNQSHYKEKSCFPNVDLQSQASVQTIHIIIIFKIIYAKKYTIKSTPLNKTSYFWLNMERFCIYVQSSLSKLHSLAFCLIKQNSISLQTPTQTSPEVSWAPYLSRWWAQRHWQSNCVPGWEGSLRLESGSVHDRHSQNPRPS